MHDVIVFCTTIHRYPIFSTRYSVMCKVYTGYHGTSEIKHGLCACTVDNPLVKARGLSLRTGAQTMFYLSHEPSLKHLKLLLKYFLHRLDEAILIDATVYSSKINKKSTKKVTNLHRILHSLQPGYFMKTKINLRQYVTFIKPQNLDIADIKCFTVFCHWVPYFVSFSLLTGETMETEALGCRIPVFSPTTHYVMG